MVPPKPKNQEPLDLFLRQQADHEAKLRKLLARQQTRIAELRAESQTKIAEMRRQIDVYDRQLKQIAPGPAKDTMMELAVSLRKHADWSSSSYGSLIQSAEELAQLLEQQLEQMHAQTRQFSQLLTGA